MGKSTSVAIFPAIGNPIYNAIGVRITDLPITAEKVLKVIKKKKEQEGSNFGNTKRRGKQ